MNSDTNLAVDHLVRFIQVIGTDVRLRDRFCRLAELSPVQRAKEIHMMAEEMTMGRRRPSQLPDLFRLFADTRVFNAAMMALQECGYIENKVTNVAANQQVQPTADGAVSSASRSAPRAGGG